MAELPGSAVRAGRRRPIDHMGGGNAGADGDEEDVPGGAAGSEPCLGEAADAYVVAERCRHPQPRRSQLP